MVKRKKVRIVKVTVSLPDVLVDDLDQLADEVDTDRSDVIEGLLGYAFDHLDEVFPESDEEEDQEEDQDEEEE